ncbi:4497_t:CDS:2, partial [Scutellospora calospora]
AQQKMGNELNDIKKRIEGLALNYASLTTKMNNSEGNNNNPRRNFFKEQRKRPVCFNCNKIGHFEKDCRFKKTYMSKKPRFSTKEGDKPRNINYCEFIHNQEDKKKEVYNVGDEISPQETSKRPMPTKWNERLRNKNVTKIQSPKQRQDTEIDNNPTIETSNINNKSKRKRGPSIVDSLTPYDVAEDLLSLPTSATLGQLLQYPNQRKNLAKLLKRPRSSEDDYGSEGGDTFDEFDYEESDEIEGQFLEYEENPALYLTNIESVPIGDDKEEKSIEEKIQESIKNDELTPQQQCTVQMFLWSNKDMFAQGLEDLGQTNLITHTINTANALPICQGPYKTSHEQNKFVREEIAKATAVRRIERAQETAKERHDRQIKPVDDLKKGDFV